MFYPPIAPISAQVVEPPSLSHRVFGQWSRCELEHDKNQDGQQHIIFINSFPRIPEQDLGPQYSPDSETLQTSFEAHDNFAITGILPIQHPPHPPSPHPYTHSPTLFSHTTPTQFRSDMNSNSMSLDTSPQHLHQATAAPISPNWHFFPEFLWMSGNYSTPTQVQHSEQQYGILYSSTVPSTSQCDCNREHKHPSLFSPSILNTNSCDHQPQLPLRFMSYHPQMQNPPSLPAEYGEQPVQQSKPIDLLPVIHPFWW